MSPYFYYTPEQLFRVEFNIYRTGTTYFNAYTVFKSPFFFYVDAASLIGVRQAEQHRITMPSITLTLKF